MDNPNNSNLPSNSDPVQPTPSWTPPPQTPDPWAPQAELAQNTPADFNSPWTPPAQTDTAPAPQPDAPSINNPWETPSFPQPAISNELSTPVQSVPEPISTPPWTPPAQTDTAPISIPEPTITTPVNNPWGTPPSQPVTQEETQIPTWTPPAQTDTTPIPAPISIPEPTPQPTVIQPASPNETQAPAQPSWTNAPTTESVPTDLSHLISGNNTPVETAVPADTLVTPSVSGLNSEAPKTPHKGIPKWMLGLGAGLLLMVIGASAYFILGVGQPSKPTTSIPATTENTEANPPAQVAPTSQPAAEQPIASGSGSANFGELQGESTQQATSAADALRQRQAQQGI